MMNQPSSYSADSLTTPSCHGHFFPCSSSAPCNNCRHFSRFWDLWYVPWDCAMRCTFGLNFRPTYLENFPIFPATRSHHFKISPLTPLKKTALRPILLEGVTETKTTPASLGYALSVFNKNSTLKLCAASIVFCQERWSQG